MNNTFQILPEFLQKAVTSEIERITDEELEATKKRIDERKSQIIAGVVLHVQKMMEVETLGQRLIITVLAK